MVCLPFKINNMQSRYQQLDALRGYAVFTMILSGSIAFGGVLPGWMYHAQVPPPLHQFNPDLPGITWVDLVFPFFIFCMWAALPLALQKQAAANDTKAVVVIAIRRFLLLGFFALFLEQFKYARISEQPSTGTYLTTLSGFVLLFFAYSKFPRLGPQKTMYLNYAAMLIGCLALWLLPLNNGEGFRINRSDIIIMVLANMALFGTLTWWFTRNNPLLRWGILPFLMAIFLGAKTQGSWNEWLFQLSPEPAVYKFYFLKYLFIIIPGTMLGEWLLRSNNATQTSSPFKGKTWIGILLLLLIIVNVTFLYTRSLLFNLVATIALLVIGYILIKKSYNDKSVVFRFFTLGTYCLLLGLTLEAYEGGIKKDASTYSYYFVTSGLAFFGYIVIEAFSTIQWLKPVYAFFCKCGSNPMMAYVSGSLLVLPLLQLTGVYDVLSAMNDNAWLGFLKGLIFTLIACGITIPFTKKGMIWKS
jgi:predicted acyltransferase